ncbi:hypothetical protein [Maridesulfovibrio sp.]|uniref:tetratricopeptide repeat protein n=1 Tax=Maridesulfovibrio sp. TaxID=2795000 RepID=UPI003BAAD8E1
MPDKNDSEIFDVEKQLKSLAESDDLIKWLSDVDLSKYVIGWLKEEGFSGWKVKLAVKIISIFVVNIGKYGGTALSDMAQKRLLGFLKKSERVKAVLEKLEDLRKMTNQQIAAQEGLKELLKGNVDRASGNIEHRESLSLDIQAHLEELDRLYDIGVELGALKDQLSEQPEFVNPNTTGTEINKFVYRSQYIPFAGREKEIAFLESFLNSERMFSWQVIIGPGGVGKSRLGLEFCLKHGVGFRSGVLDDFDFSFKHWQPCQPTLLVVDYTAKERDKLHDIIRLLTNRENKHECKIRILILDRDSSDHQLSNLSKHRHTRDSQFEKPYLLKEPDPSIAKSIFEFFFEKESEKIPESWDSLLERLKDIDEDMRPLFAAYLGSAVAKGHGDRHFNRESLLQDVINRELEDILKPCGVTEKDLALLVLATIIGGISTQYDFDLPECVTSLGELVYEKDRFKVLNCEAHGKDKVIHQIPPWEPDLVGELFVLEFLKDDEDTGVNKYRKDILKVAWSASAFGSVKFMDRVRQDYFSHVNFSLLTGKPEQFSELSAYTWSLLAVNLINDYGDAKEFNKAQSLYADLQSLSSSEYPTSKFALQQAMGAANLIIDYCVAKEFYKAQSLYVDLKLLASSEYSTSEIVLEQARAAVSMINSYGEAREFDKTQSLYTDLQSLASSEYSTSEIVLRQAKGAFNLINDYRAEKQLDKAMSLYADLQSLASSELSTSEIVLRQAKAAVNLINDYGEAREFDKAQSLYADLQSLASSEYSTSEIVLRQANGAFNLINDYGEAKEFDKAQSFYADLQSLSFSEYSTSEIVLQQAEGAYNLINDYGEAKEFDKAMSLYADLRSLSSSEHSTSEIVLQQAKGAVNLWLLLLQPEQPEEAEKYLTEFRGISKKYSDNPEFIELSEQVASILKEFESTS